MDIFLGLFDLAWQHAMEIAWATKTARAALVLKNKNMRLPFQFHITII